MIFESNMVKGRTINDCWRDSLWCAVRNGYDYRVEKGSYEGQIRKQLDYLVIIVEEPWTRPLSVYIPEGLGFGGPTSEEKIVDYCYNYLLSDKRSDFEDYTYGEYIIKQLDRAIEVLVESKGNTNQSLIRIGNEDSINLESPPCLVMIDFKVVDKRLNMSVYFRSWDIFSGMPENLGGLQMLKENTLTYLQAFLDRTIEDGKLIAYSSGAHIYEQYFGLVNQLCVDKIE